MVRSGVLGGTVSVGAVKLVQICVMQKETQA